MAVEYRDFPTVEWTVYFKNSGQADTPILSDIQGLDLSLQRGSLREFVLHHHKGTFVRADDFEPLTTTLTPSRREKFAPPAGRPCGHVWPYFNVEWAGEGAIVAVGWPGQWSAEFAWDEVNGLRVRAGQQATRLKLSPPRKSARRRACSNFTVATGCARRTCGAAGCSRTICRGCAARRPARC